MASLFLVTHYSGSLHQTETTTTPTFDPPKTRGTGTTTPRIMNAGRPSDGFVGRGHLMCGVDRMNLGVAA